MSGSPWHHPSSQSGNVSRTDARSTPGEHYASSDDGNAHEIARNPIQPTTDLLLPFLVVAGLALLVRIAYLHQIESIPFFEHPVSDGRRYWDWAGGIAAGNWWGGEPFHQAPLYPYFLAAARTLVGADPWVVHVVQATLGAAGCGLIALAGGLLVSRKVGWLAGVWMALYPPAIFFDGLLQTAGLAMTLTAGLLALLGWCQRRPTLPGWFAAGACLGLLSLTRENALVLVPALAFWLLVRFTDRRWRTRALWCGAFSAGVALVLGPVALRNRDVGGGWSLTTVQAGPNFYIGNHDEATGRYVPLRPGHELPSYGQRDATTIAEQAVGKRLNQQEVSDYWLRRGLEFVRAHPARWLRLLGYKLLLVINDYEIPDYESFYLYAEHSRLLAALGGLSRFGVLLPVAAAGVVLTWIRRRDLTVLFLTVVVMAGAVAIFYVTGRYRYPLVGPVMILAASGVIEVADRLRRSSGPLLPAAVVALAVVVVANLRINPENRLNAVQHLNLGVALARQGRVNEAVPCFERALSSGAESAEAHYNLAMASAMQARFAEAVEHYRAALRLDAEIAQADYNLAVALEQLGRTTEAVMHYRRAVEIDPFDAEARLALARLGAATTAP